MPDKVAMDCMSMTYQVQCLMKLVTSYKAIGGRGNNPRGMNKFISFTFTNEVNRLMCYIEKAYFYWFLLTTYIKSLSVFIEISVVCGHIGSSVIERGSFRYSEFCYEHVFIDSFHDHVDSLSLFNIDTN